jgi:O-antigen ligase
MSLSIQVRDISQYHELWVKFALAFFGLALWHKPSAIAAGSLLILIWIQCGGLLQLRSVIKNSLSLALLFLCGVLLLGLLWSDYPNTGRFRWDKYLGLLIFIPYLSLLNKGRLFWAGGGVVIGYLGILLIGTYYQFYLGLPGIPPLKMVYLHFSMVIGVGVIAAIYWAIMSENRKVVILVSVAAAFLLLIQFHLNGRGPLFATIVTIYFIFFLLYRRKIKQMVVMMALATILIGIFVSTSSTFKGRFSEAQRNVEFFMDGGQGGNMTSIGERIAYLRMGAYIIKQQPFFGHGTGMARKAFEENVEKYEEGRYKDVLNYSHSHSLHYHNDLIEMGVYLGLLGISTYLFLLWSWFQSLRVHGLPILGATMVFFVFMAGLTDVILIYGQIPSLLLAITAIAIVWQREYGNLGKENHLK